MNIMKLLVLTLFFISTAWANCLVELAGCPESFIELNSQCYYIENIKKADWHTANELCRSIDAHLISIETETEYNTVTNHLKHQKEPTNGYWTSGNDISKALDFHWMGTGEPFGFTKWGPNQPDNSANRERCVHLIYGHDNVNEYRMNDYQCEVPNYFVCEKQQFKKLVCFY